MISALPISRPILYIDMDNVLVDFQSGINRLSKYEKREYEGRYDEVPNIFAKMCPYEGAINAYHYLVRFMMCTFFPRHHGIILLPGQINLYG